MAKERNSKNKNISTDFFLEEEIKNLKLFIASYMALLVCMIGGFIVWKIKATDIPVTKLEAYWRFGLMVGFNLSSSIYAALTIYYKKKIFLAKYVLAGVMAGVITLGMLWLGTIWIFLGYYLLLVMFGLFYDWKISLFTGASCLFFFFLLFLYSPFFQKQEIHIWIMYFFPTVAVVTFINRRNYHFIKELFQGHQELEKAKSGLEIKVAARTKQLRKFSENQEKQVKQRTKELQERVDELERFRKVTVGRELKMVELKKEIKELKEESKRKV